MTGRPTRLIPDPLDASPGGDLVASRIISTQPIKLLTLVIMNTNVALQYILLFQSSTLPADTAVPSLPAIPVAGSSVLAFDFGSSGIDLDKLTVCNSSTADVKTIGAADCQIVATVAG